MASPSQFPLDFAGYTVTETSEASKLVQECIGVQLDQPKIRLSTAWSHGLDPRVRLSQDCEIWDHRTPDPHGYTSPPASSARARNIGTPPISLPGQPLQKLQLSQWARSLLVEDALDSRHKAPVRPTHSQVGTRVPSKLPLGLASTPVRNDGQRSRRSGWVSKSRRTSCVLPFSGPRLVCTGTRGARSNSSGCAAATSARDAWNLWRVALPPALGGLAYTPHSSTCPVASIVTTTDWTQN